jgi:hypothetical protein
MRYAAQYIKMAPTTASVTAATWGVVDNTNADATTKGERAVVAIHSLHLPCNSSGPRSSHALG